MGPEGSILVNSSISTFQQGLTHSALPFYKIFDQLLMMSNSIILLIICTITIGFLGFFSGAKQRFNDWLIFMESWGISTNVFWSVLCNQVPKPNCPQIARNSGKKVPRNQIYLKLYFLWKLRKRKLGSILPEKDKWKLMNDKLHVPETFVINSHLMDFCKRVQGWRQRQSLLLNLWNFQPAAKNLPFS